jgi:hypothetical protein
LDVRYHRSPNSDPDGPDKTMLGTQQRAWFLEAIKESKAVFKFPVSGSSWNCGGEEAWNHPFLNEYDAICDHIRESRISGIVLLGGDQHDCKICVRPGESWDGYDLHEWMAGQLWNRAPVGAEPAPTRGFGVITVDTTADPPTARLEFLDENGNPKNGTRALYTTPGALRALWNSPPGVIGKPPRAVTGEIGRRAGPLWDALPKVDGETLTLDRLSWPAEIDR